MRRVRVHRALYCRGRVEEMMRGSRHAGLGLSRLVAARVRILEVSNTNTALNSESEIHNFSILVLLFSLRHIDLINN